jgi:two-component system KDP operon response regulator KdpE
MTKEEILIIDDEHQIRKLLEINLESNGYKVTQASDASMGIKLAASHPPDLILLDIGLPDKSGLDVLKELRTWYKHSIIMLSVIDNEESIVQGLDNGASDYVTKPFRVNELLARIRSCLNRNKVIEHHTILEFDNIQIDLVARIVKNDREVIKLTTT